MLMTDVGRGLLIGSIPIAYAFGAPRRWTQLYIVAFLSGTLTVFFYVAYGAMIQMIVPRDRLRAGELARARQPRVLVRRRQHARRPARRAAARPVRAGGRRRLVLLVGALPRRGCTLDEPPGAPAARRAG